MLGRLFHIRRGIASPVENAARVVKETRITLAFKPEQRPMIERALNVSPGLAASGQEAGNAAMSGS